MLGQWLHQRLAVNAVTRCQCCGAAQAAHSATTAGQLSGTVRHEPQHYYIDLVYWGVISAPVSTRQGSTAIPLTIRLVHASAAVSTTTENLCHRRSYTQLLGVTLHCCRRRLTATADKTTSSSAWCCRSSFIIWSRSAATALSESCSQRKCSASGPA